MKHAFAIRSLVAAAGFAAAVTSAFAGDYNIGRGQETAIQPGMTADAVHSQFGAPTEVQKLANGSIWSYKVLAEAPAIPDSRNMFEVRFGRDGKVRSANEFVEVDEATGD